MTLTRLSVHNVRSYDLYAADIHPDITLVLGPNGTGKTTLLEAIYVLHQGTSFRGRDRDMIPYERERGELKLEFDQHEPRKATISLQPDGRISKQFKVGESSSGRLAAKHRLPVVLFEPDELRLLTSSPQRRRDFMDGIIGRLSTTYQTVLNRYARVLAQRNELLKQFNNAAGTSRKASFRGRHAVSGFTPETSGGVKPFLDMESHIFAWDIKLAELGATIIHARINFLSHANEHLSRLYSGMANRSQVVEARYISPYVGNGDELQQVLLHQLERTRQSDALKGFTSTGPHRDDMELLLDTHPAASVASRGEMRTIMLAFKLLEVELQTKHSGQKPLILLDDVFSELDITREKALMQALRGHQTIITATDLRDELKVDATIINL